MGLFAFLGRWLGSHDRNIFEFWDGSRTWLGRKKLRRIDPFVAYKATFHYPGFSWERTMAELAMEPIGTDPKDIEFQLRGKLAALEVAAACTRSVMQIKPLDQGGLTDQECVWLLHEFEQFVLGEKKNGRQPQNSPPSAESIQTPATRNDLASGSIETESEPSTPSGQPRVLAGESAGTSE